MIQVVRELMNGKPVSFRPSGHSMEPLIRHRQLVTVDPVDPALHRIGATQGDAVRIENNRGKINGCTNRRNVFGRLAS
jgi:hypothetical protein